MTPPRLKQTSLVRWLCSPSSTSRCRRPTAEAPPVASLSAESPWVDLDTNLPGAAARGQALSAHDAAPVRTIFARALGVRTDERAWRIGADNEEKVAAQLAKVIEKDPRWRVIDAISVDTGGSDINDLVIASRARRTRLAEMKDEGDERHGQSRSPRRPPRQRHLSGLGGDDVLDRGDGHDVVDGDRGSHTCVNADDVTSCQS